GGTGYGECQDGNVPPQNLANHGYSQYGSRAMPTCESHHTCGADGKGDQSFDNTAHTNADGDYIFRDKNGYCWVGTYTVDTGYTAVVEATGESYPEYGGACVNIADTGPTTGPTTGPSTSTSCNEILTSYTWEEEAGPIWDQSDAQDKCPTVCGDKNADWNGHWHTTIQGEMSVCNCSQDSVVLTDNQCMASYSSETGIATFPCVYAPGNADGEYFNVEMAKMSEEGYIFNVSGSTELTSTLQSSCLATYSSGAGEVTFPCVSVANADSTGTVYEVPMTQATGGELSFTVDETNLKTVCDY
ncbi:mannan-binding lectin, partial [Candidatus Halobeggiatoa sp. HSG11]|nr:mannan-binding lectin [Candidatus Halobeggiatoa sp. HSG11]